MKHFILHIETATSVCGAALSADAELISTAEINRQNVHAEHLTQLIDEVMQQAGFTYKNLSAVSVSSGPGSYTGLRIGVSTAKGLCFALDIPLLAISTLDAMTTGMSLKTEAKNISFLCPMLDARRMEVYAAVYQSGEKVLNDHAEIINENSYREWLDKGRVLFFGTGAEKCKPVLGQHANAVFADDFLCSATYQTQIAYADFMQQKWVDTAYFEPYYLKEFQGVK